MLLQDPSYLQRLQLQLFFRSSTMSLAVRPLLFQAFTSVTGDRRLRTVAFLRNDKNDFYIFQHVCRARAVRKIQPADLAGLHSQK
jgi:hypothetical protein